VVRPACPRSTLGNGATMMMQENIRNIDRMASNQYHHCRWYF
jgi:hypothetical protein